MHITDYSIRMFDVVLEYYNSDLFLSRTDLSSGCLRAFPYNLYGYRCTNFAGNQIKSNGIIFRIYVTV